MTRWGRADNSVVVGHSCRRSLVLEGSTCHTRESGLVLLHGDLNAWLMGLDGF